MKVRRAFVGAFEGVVRPIVEGGLAVQQRAPFYPPAWRGLVTPFVPGCRVEIPGGMALLPDHRAPTVLSSLDEAM
jgi:hypothetical protein